MRRAPGVEADATIRRGSRSRTRRATPTARRVRGRLPCRMTRKRATSQGQGDSCPCGGFVARPLKLFEPVRHPSNEELPTDLTRRVLLSVNIHIRVAARDLVD